MTNYYRRLEKWINKLHKNEHYQCHQHWQLFDDDGISRAICANGIGIICVPIKTRKAHEDKQEDEYVKEFGWWDNEDPRYYEYNSLIKDYYGLSPDDINKIHVLNDEKEWSFPKIAKWMEKNLLPKAATR